MGSAIGAGGGEGGGEGGGGARQAHTLFGFEHSMSFGAAERALLGQLAWQAGYPEHGFPELVGTPEGIDGAKDTPEGVAFDTTNGAFNFESTAAASRNVAE